MRQAIQTLVDKGMLVRKRGVGTQVVHSTIRRTVELTSLNDDLASAGREPRTVVLRLDRATADIDLARHLKMDLGCDVWLLERVRFVGEQPLAILSNAIPAEVVDLDGVDLTTSGLYSHLRRCGVHMRVAHQRIGATRADSKQARLLGQRRGDPLLTMERTAFDDGGRTVEFGSHVYRPDLYSFDMTLVDR
jgi:DNA-binding GntR family transcriptional regulator